MLWRWIYQPCHYLPYIKNCRNVKTWHFPVRLAIKILKCLISVQPRRVQNACKRSMRVGCVRAMFFKKPVLYAKTRAIICTHYFEKDDRLQGLWFLLLNLLAFKLCRIFENLQISRQHACSDCTRVAEHWLSWSKFFRFQLHL